MAAMLLAKAGARPQLFERTRTGQDVVCGGFLGWDALALLGRVGVDVGALGAKPVSMLHLAAGGRSAMTELPFAAAGLSRRTLDTVLLARASDHGGAVERGITVRQLDPERRTMKLADGTDIAAQAIFLATGKHELRGSTRLLATRDDPPIGLRVRLESTPALVRALTGRIELILFDRGYAGLVLQEDDSANLCFTVAQSRLTEQGGDRERLLTALASEAPLLGERIGQANGLSGWASVARVPYGWRAPATSAGLFRLGDQAAVIASLAGDGIAIALASAHRAVEHYLKHGPEGSIAFQHSFRRRARRPLWIAERLRSLAESQGLASAGVALMKHFPSAARAASHAVRIGAY